MGGYWTQDTETLALQQHLFEDVHLRLFTNPLSVTRHTNIACLTTPESGYLNYAPQVVGVGSWVVTSADPYNSVSAPQVIWTLMGSFGPAYGYYYTYANCETLLAGCVERFDDGPYSLIRTGQQLSVTPMLGARGVSSWA